MSAMRKSHLVGALLLVASLLAPSAGAQVSDLSKYPDFTTGQWRRAEGGGPRYDPSKPPRRGQQAPLTPEYQALYEANLKDQAAGGQGLDQTYRCIPSGMPRQMAAGFPWEILISPHTTHFLFEFSLHTARRIYTDGRDWPQDEEPTFAGYSIGKWLDTTGSGRFDMLEVETRNLKGPRTFDGSGIPMHEDNATVIKERIYLDKANPDLLHNDITTIDNALTRPWSVAKTYARQKKVKWNENLCTENNNHVVVGKDAYMLSADGYLMPVRRDQAPPDLRYFKQPGK
jgi:hypothetical protein